MDSAGARLRLRTTVIAPNINASPTTIRNVFLNVFIS